MTARATTSSTAQVAGPSPQTAPLLQAIRSLAPGAVAGAVQVLVGHPFDTVKTRAQSLRHSGVPGGSVQAARSIWVTDGARGFYRGVTPPLLLTGVKRSAQMAIWEALLRLQALGSPPQPVAANGDQNESSKKGNHNRSNTSGGGLQKFAAGAVSGVLGSLIGAPMHVVKVQTQLASSRETRSALTCAAEIFRTRGLRGFYAGFAAHAVKDAAFASVYLGLYGWMRARAKELQKQKARPCPTSDPVSSTATAAAASSVPSMGYTIAAGAIAATATWALLLPLDTIKTVAQSGRYGSRSPAAPLPDVAAGPAAPNGQAAGEYVRGSRDAVERLFCRGGTAAGSAPTIRGYTEVVIARLWSGLGPALMRAGPANGLSMAAYEACLSYCKTCPV